MSEHGDGSADGPAAGDPPAHAGYDEWVDALADGGFYVECAEGHGSLPPRRVCPECGSRDLSTEPLAEAGEIATFSEIHVAPPSFADETPYVTAVADFGPVRLTGVVRGPSSDEVAIGTAVRPDVEDAGEDGDGDGDRLVVLRPA